MGRAVRKRTESPYHQSSFGGYNYVSPFVTIKELTANQLFNSHVKYSVSGVISYNAGEDSFGNCFNEVYSHSNIYTETYSNSFTATEVYSSE